MNTAEVLKVQDLLWGKNLKNKSLLSMLKMEDSEIKEHLPDAKDRVLLGLSIAHPKSINPKECLIQLAALLGSISKNELDAVISALQSVNNSLEGEETVSLVEIAYSVYALTNLPPVFCGAIVTLLFSNKGQ